jgi:hypothetical protein
MRGSRRFQVVWRRHGDHDGGFLAGGAAQRLGAHRPAQQAQYDDQPGGQRAGG